MTFNVPKEMIEADLASVEVRTIAAAISEAAVDPEPCRACSSFRSCADFRLACANYEAWVERGRSNEFPKVPTSEIYWRLFPNDIQGQPTPPPNPVRITIKPVKRLTRGKP